MELLQNGYTLELCDGAFPLSTDSMALAAFARLPKNARVLDLGSGCGTLGLLLCAGNDNCRVTGMELSEEAHAMAQQNICRNGIPHRMESICADLRSIPSRFQSGSFCVCISNPPYFSSGAVSVRTPQARHELSCSLEDLFRSAAWATKYGGDFYLVHKPDRIAQLISLGSKFGLEAKRLGLLRHSSKKPISLVLLQFRKGANPGLAIEEICLYDAAGQPTEDHRRIYQP